jgi:predicted  nucleic acid-binding Zn-ribbon protein
MTSDLLSTQEMEEAFGELAKEDLLLALQRAKEQMDSLEELVSSQTLEIESLQSGSSDLSARLLASDTESRRLAHLVQQREARIDEMNNDQAKLEDEIYNKLGIVERLKTRADEGDRKRAEAERKLADAVSSFSDSR